MNRTEKLEPQLISELALFEQEHPTLWRDHPNKFVTIFRGNILGFSDTSEDAHTVGYESEAGFDKPFLVRQILQDKFGPIDICHLMNIAELAKEQSDNPTD